VSASPSCVTPACLHLACCCSWKAAATSYLEAGGQLLDHLLQLQPHSHQRSGRNSAASGDGNSSDGGEGGASAAAAAAVDDLWALVRRHRGALEAADTNHAAALEALEVRGSLQGIGSRQLEGLAAACLPAGPGAYCGGGLRAMRFCLQLTGSAVGLQGCARKSWEAHTRASRFATCTGGGPCVAARAAAAAAAGDQLAARVWGGPAADAGACMQEGLKCDGCGPA
jgi:hypothetical protein